MGGAGGERGYRRAIPRLAGYELVYLATPYTRYAAGLDRAAGDAARVSARLIGDGVRAYAPIVYTHALGGHCGVSRTDEAFWMAFDAPFMDACDALAVAMLPGWSGSRGVALEIDRFERAGKPIVLLPVAWLLDATRCAGQGGGSGETGEGIALHAATIGRDAARLRARAQMLLARLSELAKREPGL